MYKPFGKIRDSVRCRRRLDGHFGTGSTPQELDRFWRQQLAYLGKVVKDANVKPME